MLKKLFYTDYHADLIRIFIHSIYLSTIAINIVIPIFIGYLFYNYFHIAAVGIWLSLHVLIFIFRLHLYTKLLKVLNSNHKSQFEYYLKWYASMVLSTGILWGIFAVCSVLYVNEEYIIIIIFVLLGLTGSSIMTIGSMNYLFGSFIILILLPLCISLFYTGGEINSILGIWVLLYFVILIKGNNRYYALFLNSILLNKNLIENKTKYELIFDKALDGILILEDGKFTDCNESIVKMLKYKNKEAILNSQPSLLSPKKQPDGRLSSEKAEEMINLAYRHRGHQFEWTHTRATGEDFCCEIVLTPIIMDEKEILHVVWRDISERKKIENENAKLRDQVALAFSGSGDGLWDWNILEDSIYFSPRWKEILGYKDHELKNKFSVWEERVHPDDIEKIRKCANLNISGKINFFELKYRLKHKEGHWVWVYDRGQTIYNVEGRATRMLGTHTDITEEINLRTELEKVNKNLEEKIEEAIADLKKSQRQAMLGSWKLDISANTLSWSDITYEIFELPMHEKIATYENFLGAIHPDDRERVNSAYASSLENKNEYSIEHRLQMADGRIKYVREHCETTFDDDDNPLVSIGTIQDITTEHNAIEELRYKDELMFRQSRLAQMGEMISMIAHQWRQPLSAISATSAYMELKANMNRLDNKTALEKAHDISNFSQQLSSTIDDFRNFFKPNNRNEDTNYDAIVISVLNIIKTSISYYNIQLIQELHCHDTFNTYVNEMRQVILNLMKNAEDAIIETKTKNPYIKIYTYKENDKLILEVSDNAGGIREDIIGKVFDPYFSTKTKIEGTGIGLYMSKLIIEEHCGGELSVSNGNDGAVFKIIFEQKG